MSFRKVILVSFLTLVASGVVAGCAPEPGHDQTFTEKANMSIQGQWLTRNVDIDFGASGYWPGPAQTWTISQPGAVTIRVHFSRLDTRYGDVVEVMDLSTGTALEYQGPSRPAFWSSEVDSEEVTIQFDPNVYASSYNRGFAIDQIEYYTFTDTEPDPEPEPDLTCAEVDCPAGQHCEILPAPCWWPPCQEFPNCVDDDGDDGRLPGESCSESSDCSSVEGHGGLCHGGICMVHSSDDYCTAGSTASCPSGSRCWSGSGIGICYPDCDTYSCDGACDSDGSCVGS